MGSVTIIIVMFIATIGPAFVIGITGFSAIKALGRNPSAASKIFLSMILAFIFSEAVAVVALLAIMNIFQ